MSPPRQGRSSRLLAAGFVGALLLAGCGASGGKNAADETTSTVAAGNDNTTTPDGGSGETTTTETDSEPVDVDALDALLPDAAAIGPDYRATSDEEDDDGEQNESDEAIKKACPRAAALMSDRDDDEAKTTRLFETADGRNVEITLDPSPSPNLDSGTIDTVIDAVNECDTIEIENKGVAFKMDLEAEGDATYGDRGVVMRMHAVMNHAQFPAPIDINFIVRSYVLGSVAVTVSASDGVDEDALEAVPGDYDLVDSLAAQLEPKVADLVGG